MDKHEKTLDSTAWMIAYRRTFTDIPYSREIFREFEKIRTSKDETEIPDEYKSAVLAPQIEARYKLINKLIRMHDAKQVLEIASGLSPRGFEMTEDKDTVFIEIDLPNILNPKQEITKIIVGKRANLHLICGTALDLGSLQRAVKLFNRGEKIVITHEGLLRYLTLEEKAIVARNIHKILEDFDGVWITPDITLRSVLQSENKATDNHVDKILNKVTDLDVNKNSFSSVAEAEKFFEELGFSVEKHSFKEIKNELISPGKLGLTDKDIDCQLDGPFVFVMKAL